MKITFEIEETTFFKTAARTTLFCEYCRQPVEVLNAQTAASITGLNECQILRLVESGDVHFSESDKIYICCNSLEISAEIFKQSCSGLNEILKKSAEHQP